MNEGQISAQVQYRDWHGEIKLDNADHNTLHDLLVSRKLLHGDEFVVGFRMWSGENGRFNETEPKPFSMTVVAVRAADFESAAEIVRNEPYTAREICFDLTPNEFALLFKRLSFGVGWQSLPVIGTTYQYEMPDDEQ